MVSEPSGSRFDTSTMASIVKGVINVLGLQPSQLSSAFSTAATYTLTQTRTQTRRTTKFVCSFTCLPDHISIFVGSRNKKGKSSSYFTMTKLFVYTS